MLCLLVYFVKSLTGKHEKKQKYAEIFETKAFLFEYGPIYLKTTNINLKHFVLLLKSSNEYVFAKEKQCLQNLNRAVKLKFCRNIFWANPDILVKNIIS
jgi:hypothetical protein